MKKRNLLVSLKFNVELSKVAYSFLSSIHNKIILLSLIKKIRRATQNKRELEIRKEQIKDKDEVIGNSTQVRVVKNKVAPPFKVAKFDIMYGTGISKTGTILDTAVDFGIVDKAGSWYSYDGERLGQGRENIKNYLEENQDVCNEIEAKVREHAKNLQYGKQEEVVEEDSDKIE